MLGHQDTLQMVLLNKFIFIQLKSQSLVNKLNFLIYLN